MVLPNSTRDYLPPPGFFIAMVGLQCLGIIIGVIGNIMVILYNVFAINPKLPTTYFVISLATTDLLVCCTCYPVWLIEFASVAVGESCIVHDLFCKIGFTTLSTGGALSIANLLAITIDRFIYISKPLKYPMIMTWARTYVVLSIIWLLAIVNISFVYFNTGKDTRLFYCTNPLSVVIIFFTFDVYIPITGILSFNYKIYKVARNQRRRIKSESCSGVSSSSVNHETQSRRRSYLQQLKQIKTFAIIVVAMLLCAFPSGLVAVVDRFNICKYCLPTSVYLVAVNIFGVNSLVNPIIYATRSKEYRIAFRHFLYKIINKNY